MTGFILYCMLPLLGVGGLGWLWLKMEQAKVPDPPYGGLLVVFATYGALLLIVVTGIFRLPWSGMHTVGLLGLVFVMTWLLPLLGHWLVRNRSASAYHRATQLLSAVYLLVVVFGLLLLWVVESSRN